MIKKKNIDYYQVVSEHAQEAVLSFARTGSVENFELVDRYPVSIRNPTQISRTIRS